jgi:hypothetical protein
MVNTILCLLPILSYLIKWSKKTLYFLNKLLFEQWRNFKFWAPQQDLASGPPILLIKKPTLATGTASLGEGRAGVSSRSGSPHPAMGAPGVYHGNFTKLDMLNPEYGIQLLFSINVCHNQKNAMTVTSTLDNYNLEIIRN